MNIRTTSSALLLCLSLILGSSPASLHAAREVTEKPAEDTPVKSPSRKVYVYKESAGKPRELEIYFPPSHDPKKVKVPGLILFHGGAWSGGTRNQFQVACEYFASRGLVCATVDYQLVTKGQSKSVCITDAKSAIRWFKQHGDELGIDPNRIITGGGSAGGHVSALATMNPGLNDPADPKDIDTSVVAYLWFNPAFAPGDKKDADVDILQQLKADLPPAICFFGSEDKGWKPGWDAAYAKWQSIGAKSIDYQIAPGQTHSFFNKEPWRTVTLIAADRFLVKQGLLTGGPPLQAPVTGEKLVPSP